MAGKIFYRERLNAEEGDKTPRFNVVAVSDMDLTIHAKHLRKGELEQIAKATGAELFVLEVEDKGHKSQDSD